MEDQPLPLTVMLTNDSAKAVRVMSHVFGQSADQFVEMILKKFFFDQVDEDRTERVEMIAELLCEMPFPTESEAEQASYRLEDFANLYGPNNSKDLQIRTKVLRYEDKDWGVECDYRQARGSWRKIGFNHRPLIEGVPA
jgi:hypothetical protein